MAAGDLATVAGAQAWLGFTGDDAVLQTLITATSAFVVKTLNRGVLSQGYVETYRANGKDRMLLRQRPVTAVALVEWPGFKLSDQGDAFAETPGVTTDGSSLLLVGYRMPIGGQIRVTYTAGYDTVPPDVEQAVVELVGEAYTGKKHIGEVSHAVGGQTTVSFSQKAMHDLIAKRLSNYMAAAPLC